jgi:hypothetical protein
MQFLPGYVPELNPVELLNRDIKRHVAQQTQPAQPTPPRRASAADRTQSEVVKAFFRKPEVRSAAAGNRPFASRGQQTRASSDGRSPCMAMTGIR